MNSTNRRHGDSIARLLVAALLALATAARSQARPTATGPGTSVRIGSGASLYDIVYGQRSLAGTVAWADANPTWRLGVEGEARWLRLHDDAGTRQSTYLLGPRLTLRPGRIEPYLKFLAGAGLMQFPFNYGHGGYFVAAAGAGVDLHLGRRFQLRALDAEYQAWPQFSFGAIHPYGISSGISYTITRGSTEPTHLRR